MIYNRIFLGGKDDNVPMNWTNWTTVLMLWSQKWNFGNSRSVNPVFSFFFKWLINSGQPQNTSNVNKNARKMHEFARNFLMVAPKYKMSSQEFSSNRGLNSRDAHHTLRPSPTKPSVPKRRGRWHRRWTILEKGYLKEDKQKTPKE